MAETVQEFAARHEFFLTRAEARARAREIGGPVRDLGIMGNGSYGLRATRRDRNTIRVWAVEIAPGRAKQTCATCRYRGDDRRCWYSHYCHGVTKATPLVMLVDWCNHWEAK